MAVKQHWQKGDYYDERGKEDFNAKFWCFYSSALQFSKAFNSYTIMGETADQTVVQETITDILHKEGKTQKVTTKEASCSQSSAFKPLGGKEIMWHKNVHKQQG